MASSERPVGPTPRRSLAWIPATPSDWRWKTATMYARTPVTQMIQTRPGVLSPATT